MRQFVADAPKAHESLSTEARRVPVQGTPIPLISVFIAILRLGTVWNDLFSAMIAELLGLIVSISLDDSTTAGGAWHFCVGRLLLLHSKSGPVALSTITASVNWLSDKRYLCVSINHQIGPLSRTEQKSLWPQAVSGEQNIDKAWWFDNSRRGMTLLRRETLAFAQQKWPGGTLYHYGLRELAQRQAVYVR